MCILPSQDLFGRVEQDLLPSQFLKKVRLRNSDAASKSATRARRAPTAPENLQSRVDAVAFLSSAVSRVERNKFPAWVQPCNSAILPRPIVSANLLNPTTYPATRLNSSTIYMTRVGRKKITSNIENNIAVREQLTATSKHLHIQNSKAAEFSRRWRTETKRIALSDAGDTGKGTCLNVGLEPADVADAVQDDFAKGLKIKSTRGKVARRHFVNGAAMSALDLGNTPASTASRYVISVWAMAATKTRVKRAVYPATPPSTGVMSQIIAE
ncbi:hypothetical protein FB451DRAFT_1165154 [Mycena latifolia]|nr:hypothetical protein FB451DRAFT_1165154 [Mycena latifolia]